MRSFRLLIMIFLVLAILLFTAIAMAEQGVTDKEIVIGMSTALSGPASILGTSFKSGVELYLDEVNSGGGVYGRKIKLIAYDDQYEPTNAVAQVKTLDRTDRIFCLLGDVGTPTALAIKPILDEQKIPLFAPFTGAASLRVPVDRYIFNYRASYDQEAETFVQGMVDVLRYDKIAVFYQDDGYGKAVLEGTKLALKKRGLNPVATGAYTRNYEDIIPAMETIMAEKPQAVVMAGTYSACARFIRVWKRKVILAGNPKNLDPVFMNVSFVGPEPLAALLENYGNGVVVTQVVPPYSQGDANFAAVKEYLSILGRHGYPTPPNAVSLEGYLATKVFVEILRRNGKNLTRESFIQTAEATRNLDIQAGNRISFSHENHQGSQFVYPTLIQNGVFVPLSDWRAVKSK
ncbi:MAG TPA: ABC transporter substrate-binding protein [Nitrospirota bacterium]|nr:ABC transporter substrate-binding protein [Nitrospirota bacterium]